MAQSVSFSCACSVVGCSRRWVRHGAPETIKNVLFDAMNKAEPILGFPNGDLPQVAETPAIEPGGGAV
jgi:hypothetical protein